MNYRELRLKLLEVLNVPQYQERLVDPNKDLTLQVRVYDRLSWETAEETYQVTKVEKSSLEYKNIEDRYALIHTMSWLKNDKKWIGGLQESFLHLTVLTDLANVE